MKFVAPTMPRANAPLTTSVISVQAMTIRRASGCLASIAVLRQAEAKAVHGMQQRLGERLVEPLAPLVDMAAQRIAVRHVITPTGLFHRFAAHTRRAALPEARQQLWANPVRGQRPSVNNA